MRTTVRALSLVELVITLACLGLLGMGLAYMLSLSIRKSHSSQRQRDETEGARRALARLEAELTNSSATLTRFSASQLTFPSAQIGSGAPLIQDTQGKLVWQAWILYAWDATTGELWRSEMAVRPPAVDPGRCPALADFQGFRQNLCRQVTQFQAGPMSARGVVPVLIQVGETRLTSAIAIKN